MRNSNKKVTVQVQFKELLCRRNAFFDSIHLSNFLLLLKFCFSMVKTCMHNTNSLYSNLPNPEISRVLFEI